MNQQRDSKRVARRFLRSLPTYESEARVQKDDGTRLLDLIDACCQVRWQNVLEIGCCTGMLSQLLCDRQQIDTLYLNDLVDEFCLLAADRVRGKVNKVELMPGDVEQIEMPGQLDLIISSATLQWLVDLPHFLKRTGEALVTNGYLGCAMFGPGTMAEIRELTNIGLDYPSADMVRAALKPHFRIVLLEQATRKIFFSSPREVLRHIQRTGVSGVGEFRWTPGRLRTFETQYQQRYGEDEGMPLSYTSIYLIAQKR